ncbi:MAG: glycosyltransferase family 2 protein [Candidatus Asgardarchaeia archaeon]
MNNNFPSVSVIIPTYKRKDKLSRLLNSIVRSNYPNDKIEIIVVVDNDGNNYDDLMQKYPNVCFIFNEIEKYLAESRNIGIRKSKGEYIFLIDDDNVVDERCITELVTFMKNNSHVGIAGPIMYYLKAPKRIWCAGVKRNYYTSITKFIGKDEVDKGQFPNPIPSDDFPNSFMIKREVIEKIGYFDSKNFPIHYDEADFCRRATIAGFSIYMVPTAKVWHDIVLPEEISEKARLYHVNNALKAYYVGRNRIIFHRKYSTFIQFLFFILLFHWIIMISYLFIILFGTKGSNKRRIRIALSYIKGVITGLKWLHTYLE